MLVDAHPGAVVALRQLVNDLNLESFVANIAEADATQYQPEGAIDLLVLEAMQHGFTKGQLSIAKHLVQFLALDGWLIPQNVSVKA